ncbi:flavonoid 3 -monooxygenase-like [Olea europaea subsp. europaea]|uniref:Flavonoid 3 -monooxygenase-like n=1 Tax=Olea europaea subsp. europaea TaxID=158383 RepID=A0A8S0P7R5_OLEEU|nr:flavonoid 3 -monooxygenase-like [Olea europaea subsp. europaea]
MLFRTLALQGVCIFWKHYINCIGEIRVHLLSSDDAEFKLYLLRLFKLDVLQLAQDHAMSNESNVALGFHPLMFSQDDSEENENRRREDMVIGGTDTTSNAVEFALAEMIKKPQVLNIVQQELESVVGKDNIVEESHINKFPYLYAVMKEALRLHPTLPLLVPDCPSETCTVGGYTISKVARVFVNVWAIHHDPTIWENLLEFSPERFLDGKWDYSGNDFKYFPFGLE